MIPLKASDKRILKPEQLEHYARLIERDDYWVIQSRYNTIIKEYERETALHKPTSAEDTLIAIHIYTAILESAMRYKIEQSDSFEKLCNERKLL